MKNFFVKNRFTYPLPQPLVNGQPKLPAIAKNWYPVKISRLNTVTITALVLAIKELANSNVPDIGMLLTISTSTNVTRADGTGILTVLSSINVRSQSEAKTMNTSALSKIAKQLLLIITIVFTKVITTAAIITVVITMANAQRVTSQLIKEKLKMQMTAGEDMLIIITQILTTI